MDFHSEKAEFEQLMEISLWSIALCIVMQRSVGTQNFPESSNVHAIHALWILVLLACMHCCMSLPVLGFTMPLISFLMASLLPCGIDLMHINSSLEKASDPTIDVIGRPSWNQTLHDLSSFHASSQHTCGGTGEIALEIPALMFPFEGKAPEGRPVSLAGCVLAFPLSLCVVGAHAFGMRLLCPFPRVTSFLHDSCLNCRLLHPHPHWLPLPSSTPITVPFGY